MSRLYSKCITHETTCSLCVVPKSIFVRAKIKVQCSTWVVVIPVECLTFWLLMMPKNLSQNPVGMAMEGWWLVASTILVKRSLARKIRLVMFRHCGDVRSVIETQRHAFSWICPPPCLGGPSSDVFIRINKISYHISTCLSFGTTRALQRTWTYTKQSAASYKHRHLEIDKSQYSNLL